MKMDIQTYEHKAFAHATKLLNEVYIPYLFIEWEEMKKHYVSESHMSTDKTMVVNMMYMFNQRGYHPYDKMLQDRLDLNQWHLWPADMVWWRDVNRFAR